MQSGREDAGGGLTATVNALSPSWIAGHIRLRQPHNLSLPSIVSGVMSLFRAEERLEEPGEETLGADAVEDLAPGPTAAIFHSIPGIRQSVSYPDPIAPMLRSTILTRVPAEAALSSHSAPSPRHRCRTVSDCQADSTITGVDRMPSMARIALMTS